jgi:tyrosine-protein phosphatase YwqE
MSSLPLSRSSVRFFSHFPKDQYEQQTKDLRKQLKQVNEEKDKVQEELQSVSQQMTRINEEKVREYESFEIMTPSSDFSRLDSIAREL